jgi:hypothetical protein
VDGRLTDLDRLVRTVDALRPELPGLAEDGWAVLRPLLDDLLEQTRRRTAPEALLAARLRALLARYPAVYRRVQDALAAPQAPERWRAPTRSAGPGAEQPPTVVEGPPRFVNLAILRAADFGRVPADRPLTPGTDHLLRVDIGPLSGESIVRRSPAFPAQLLPPSGSGHWLEVGVASGDVEVPPQTFPVFLSPTGGSWVCPCPPGGGHTCRPRDRDPHLLIPLRTPAEPGSAHLRVLVWFRNTLVQSLAVAADVAPPGGSGAQSAAVDYTITAHLADLGSVRPSALSVLTNQRPDGTHSLVFNEGGGEITFTLAEGVLSGAMATVRNLLLDVHVDRRGNSRVSRFDARNAKRREPFLADLERLARNGWRLWAGLYGQQRERLREVAAEGTSTIQVARVPSSAFVFPWSAVYDIPLDVSPGVCPVVAEWDGVTEMLGGYPTTCPAGDRHPDSNTLCPFGFWGIRYGIEHPPSTAGRPLPREVRIVGDPTMVVVRSLRLDRALAESHVATVGRTLAGFAVKDVTSRADACTALADHDLEFVEFYCHGRGDPEQHWLEVGREEEIHPDQIVTWTVVDWAPPEVHWRTSAPLILLNGCHTAELTPQSPVSFVDSFAAANAGGVIGTEITLDQRLANEAAELLWGHVAAGDVGVGEAVRRLRCDLLDKGNLVGLAYTAYCSADLRLVR